MRSNVKRILAVVLAAVLLIGAHTVAFANEFSRFEPLAEDLDGTWPDVIEDVEYVGEKPSVKLELKMNGYVFKGASYPDEFVFTLVDGSTVSVKAQNRQDFTFKTYETGYTFDATVGGKKFTFCACIDTVSGYFELSEVIERDGVQMLAIVKQFDCDFDIDNGSILTRIIYRLYSIIAKIRLYFALLNPRA